MVSGRLHKHEAVYAVFQRIGKMTKNTVDKQNGGFKFILVLIGSVFVGIQFGWMVGVSAFCLFAAASD